MNVRRPFQEFPAFTIAVSVRLIKTFDTFVFDISAPHTSRLGVKPGFQRTVEYVKSL